MSGSRMRWAGRAVTGVAVLFLLFDGAIKLTQQPMAVDATVQLGYPADVIVALGVIEIACLILYLVPRTALVGAILWTGYLGGAVATHVRVGSPLASHTLFPIYIALLLWAGLWLRDGRFRAALHTATSRPHA